MARIVLGVAGGIAAYKTCSLIREFTETGHSVRVVPTPAALTFVGAATFEALSGHPVYTSVFSAVDRVEHVRIGQEADVVVIAPATADLLARLATGRADDLLTATVLVATCPVVVAPAMHTEMWLNPATQHNVAVLRERGVVVLDPAHGRLTGKDSGPGRMLEPQQIAQLSELVLERGKDSLRRTLTGKKVLVTAGGTREPLDPVRFLGNASSGRQGFAIAEVAAQRGATVHVVAGITEELPTPAGAIVEKVGSARDMRDVVMPQAEHADLAIFAAAVADYRPREAAATKLKKGSDDSMLTRLELVENPDILREVVIAREKGTLPNELVTVGFAAETGDEHRKPLDLARRKKKRKGCDLLFCNDVSGGRTFGSATNRGWLLTANDAVEEVAEASKHGVACHILDAAGRVHA